MYTIEERLGPPNQGIRRTGYTMKPRGVVWHYTGNYSATADALAHASYWAGSAEVGAHYVVDQSRIIHTAPNTEVIWHAGPGDQTTAYALKKYPKYPNFETIGVEMCVNQGSNWTETYKRSVYLGARLCIDYGWTPYQNFDRHYDMVGKDCPAMWTPTKPGGDAAWKQFLADVDAKIKELTQPTQIFVDVAPDHLFANDLNQAYRRGIFAGSRDQDGKLYAGIGEPMSSERVVVLINRAVTYILNKAGIKE